MTEKHKNEYRKKCIFGTTNTIKCSERTTGRKMFKKAWIKVLEPIENLDNVFIF